jgi:3-oxoacyl-[acyl-carrier-protein] synthase III
MASGVVVGIRYALGEEEWTYDQAPSFQRLAIESSVFNDPVGLGLGKWRKTRRNVIDLGIEAGKQTKDFAVENGLAIDLLVFCSTNFGNLGDGIAEERYLKLLTGLELQDASVLGVTLNNCTTLLSAISLASSYISSGRFENILIVSCDKVSDEANRVTDACLYSDAAVSMLLTATAMAGFRPISEASASDYRLIEKRSAFADLELSRRVHSKLCQVVGWDSARVRQLLSNNVYLPVLRIKESALGVSPEQIYVENVTRIGHCFGADPLINLCDYAAANEVRHGDSFLLTSSSAGLRASTILEYTNQHLEGVG